MLLSLFKLEYDGGFRSGLLSLLHLEGMPQGIVWLHWPLCISQGELDVNSRVVLDTVLFLKRGTVAKAVSQRLAYSFHCHHGRSVAADVVLGQQLRAAS